MTPDPRHETVRLWLTFSSGSAPETMRLRLSRRMPMGASAMAGLISRGQLAGDDDLDVTIPVGTPQAGLSAYQLAREAGYGGTLAQWLTTLIGAPGASAYQLARDAGYGGTQAQWLASLKGAPASALLGAITIGQAATVAIAAGPRRVTVTIPASWGVAAGDALVVCPTQALTGYAVHDVVATSSTQLSVGVTGPLLAIGASFSISAKLYRHI